MLLVSVAFSVAMIQTHRLRKVANEKMIHVWIVAHPTKSAQWNNVRPNMYNIAGSSNWRFGISRF